MPMGKWSSFTSHSSWKMYSARKRVLVNTSVVRCSRIAW